MGNKPQWKILQKQPDGKWRRIGAAWDSDKGGFNLSIGERGQEAKYLMVKDDYDQKRGEPKIFQEAIKTIEQENDPRTFPIDDSVPF